VDALAQIWLDYLRDDRGMSANTILAYGRSMRTLPNASTATREEVEAWWHARAVDLSQDGRPRTASSRVNELAAVRSFYLWCRIWEHRSDDPTFRITPPKIPKGLPRPISRADLARPLDTLSPDLRRAVCLGAWAGMRVSEATELDWAEVDLETNRIRVLGKGGKTRLVGISPILLDAILPDTGGNVVMAGGRPYTIPVLQRKVNRAIVSAGVKATFHQLRHRYGTIAVGSGANLLAVSRAMGHASPATTAIYAATSDAELDIIANAVVR